ncbi:MAG: hypothetical protein R3213_05960, partial [Flavobacteriaceae bacterium]|nr:hypothetical protein [Flavobacteriaceae bacterium]
MKQDYSTTIICLLLLISQSIYAVSFTERNPFSGPEKATLLFDIDDNLASGHFTQNGDLNVILESSSNLLFEALVDVAGDYRSTGGGAPTAWTNPNSWEYFNGTSWVTATSYPGQNGTTTNVVTIRTGHIITISNNTVPNSINEIIVLGQLNLNPSSSPNTINFNTTQITVNGGILNFAATKTILRLPSDAGITLLNGGQITSNTCNNNDEIFIGDRKYATCVGAPGGIYTFGEVNAAGGTFSAVITVPSTSSVNICQSSSLSITGGYNGPETDVNFQWTITNSSGEISNLGAQGTLPNNTSTTTTTYNAPTVGTFVISLEVFKAGVTN